MLLGESGSGKSTLLNIIMKNISVTTGIVKINEQDIDCIKIKNLYDKISYIKQNVELLPVDIFQNIALSETYDRTSIENILSMLKIDITKLDKKLEVNENQDNLSGGEKQRILLARLYYHMKDKDLLIFDEVTSALDVVNAVKIEEDILKIENKTIINVTHKFNINLLSLYDKIIILKKGKVSYFGEPDLSEIDIITHLI